MGSEYFTRSQFDLPPNPRLSLQEIEKLAHRVWEEDDSEALQLLQSQFFPLLCGIIKETEKNLCLGYEWREDPLDSSRMRRIPIPPWRHNLEIPDPKEAMKLLLEEFHWLLRKKWDPERGGFGPFLRKHGRRLLVESLHKAICKGAPELFQFDPHKRRALLRSGRLHVYIIPESDLEGWDLPEPLHESTLDTTDTDPLRTLAWFSNQRPDFLDWHEICTPNEFEVVVEWLETHDPEETARRLQERGRPIKPETVRRVLRRVTRRGRQRLMPLRPARKVEGHGIYARPTQERVRLRNLLRRTLGADGDFADL